MALMCAVRWPRIILSVAWVATPPEVPVFLPQDTLRGQGMAGQLHTNWANVDWGVSRVLRPSQTLEVCPAPAQASAPSTFIRPVFHVRAVVV